MIPYRYLLVFFPARVLGDGFSASLESIGIFFGALIPRLPEILKVRDSRYRSTPDKLLYLRVGSVLSHVIVLIMKYLP